MAVRTLVTFRSDKFNTYDNKPYFINPGCFGDDVARWMIEELNNCGVKADPKPGQEDFGWYLTFWHGLYSYDIVFSHNPDGYWMGWIERQRGILGSLMGLRKKGIEGEAATLVHTILLSSSDISDVRWHFEKDFDALRENLGSASPLG